MRVTWLGHGSFRIECDGQVLLLDPWLDGSPVFPADRRADVLSDVTGILVTHGHRDHADEAIAIARETGAPVAGVYDWVQWATADSGGTGMGFNKGGTIRFGDVAVTMVSAMHSSSVASDAGPIYAGHECGFMISHGSVTLYAMGDTDIMADWAWMADLHRPGYALVPIGGHFTMDGARAGWGCRRFFDLKGAIPGHYRTFPLLAQDAEAFRAAIAPTPVFDIDVMESVDLS